MSTPRRSCPRSMGMPRTPTRRLAPPDDSSGKGHTAGAAGIGGGLEEAFGSASHGVNPAEEHRELVVGEDTLVEGEVGLLRSRLVGEEIPLRVQARGVDGRLQR